MLRLRRSSSVLAVSVLVGGPTVLAFFDGGFFEQPRLVAAVTAWLLVVLGALFAERPLPRSLAGVLALGGIVLLSAWTALSLAWAPLGAAAIADLQRLALYTGVLIAAAAWLRPPRAVSAVEPGLALGAVVVVGFGMSERFLPSLIELEHSSLAFGRLEQPITYWNGMGLLAAIGLVLSSRIAGSASRPVALRMGAAAAAPLLGAGLLLTLSRGAFAAVAAGMLLLLVVAPERGQVRAVALTAISGGLAAALATLLPGLDAVGARASSSSGLVMLIVILLLSLVAALVQRRLSAGENDSARRPSEDPRRWRLAIAGMLGVIVLVATAGAIASSRTGDQDGTRPQGRERLGSLESTRYRYWDVALGAFTAHPGRGLGSGGFRVEWAREEGGRNAARDAHSLYIETAAELGLVGVVLLGVFLAGLVASTRRALAHDLQAGAGAAAVLFTWGLHAALDWDWEMPAVTLPALISAGLLVALGDRAP